MYDLKKVRNQISQIGIGVMNEILNGYQPPTFFKFHLICDCNVSSSNGTTVANTSVKNMEIEFVN